MPTNLSLQAGLLAANTAQEIAYQGFYGLSMPGTYAAYTDIKKTSERQINLNWLTNHPVMAPWLGAIVERYLRHYSQTTTFISYVASMPINRTLLAYDKTGALAEAINAFFNQQIGAYDAAVLTEWISASGAGPTCFDGTALFNTAHPHAVDAGTQSNFSSGTNLSYAALSTAEAAMSLYGYENGEPMSIVPDTLEVGSKNSTRAQELLSIDRLQTATAANAFDAGTAIAAATRTNIYFGKFKLLVNPRMKASGSGHYYWTLMDLSKAGVRPMILQENRFPEPIMDDSMTSFRRMNFDQFEYRLEGDYGVHPGMPFVAYRGTGTA